MLHFEDCVYDNEEVRNQLLRKDFQDFIAEVVPPGLLLLFSELMAEATSSLVAG